MANGKDMFDKMPDSMKRNLMEHDVKVEMLKKKIKAKKIGKIKHWVSGMGGS